MSEQTRAFFEEQDCINCGVRFGVPYGYTERRRQDKKSFYCPNGHSMAYTESEADRLRRERDRLKQDTARLEDERRAAQQREVAALERAQAAEKREARLKKRAAAGACPCCSRNFTNLARHIASKHPEFGPEQSAKVVPIKAKKP